MLNLTNPKPQRGQMRISIKPYDPLMFCHQQTEVKSRSNNTEQFIEYRAFCEQVDALEKQAQNRDQIFYKKQNDLFYQAVMSRRTAIACLAIGMSSCLVFESPRKAIMIAGKKVADNAASIFARGIDILKDYKFYASIFSILAAGSLIFFSTLRVKKIYDERRDFQFGYDKDTNERSIELISTNENKLIFIDDPETNFKAKFWSKKPTKLQSLHSIRGSRVEKEVLMLILEARHCRINEKIASIREECNLLENDIIPHNISYLWKLVNDKCLFYVHQLAADEKKACLTQLRSILPRLQEYKNRIELIKTTNDFCFDTLI